MYRDVNTSTDYPGMSKNEVEKLMLSSKSEDEWNQNCDKVKAAFGGQYPPFWYARIVQSGIAKEAAAKWGSDAEIKITAF